MSTVQTEPQKSTILIVDDDEGVTQTFARMLTLEGFQVRTAFNAETGLRSQRKASRTRSFSICACRSWTASGFSGGSGRKTVSAPRPRPSPSSPATTSSTMPSPTSCGARRRAAIQTAVARGSRRPRSQPAEGDALTDSASRFLRPADASRLTRRQSGSCDRPAAT